MTGIAWIILDAVLALTAAVGTVKVSTTPPPRPLTEEQLAGPEKTQKENDRNATAAAQPSLRPQRHKDALPERASLDDLWRSTLFLPTRAEAEPGDADAEAAAQAAALAGQNFEFELIGIAQICPAGSNPVPIAVLRSKQAGQRNDRRMPPNRRNPRDNRPDPKQQPAEKKAPEKLIFKEGDPLNGTGYLLKAIYPDQKMVEVSRGSEVIKLFINYAGEAAVQRRADATQAVAEKKKKAEEEEAKRQQSIRERQAQQQQQQNNNQANPGRPPMPPGMNNGQQNGGQQRGGQQWQQRGGQPWQRGGNNNGNNNGNNGNNGNNDPRSRQIRQNIENRAGQRNFGNPGTPGNNNGGQRRPSMR